MPIMDSTSIVSYNNESTYQNTLKGEDVNVHEIALHAMRDRCLLLQRRINTLESNNMRLKLEITKNSDKTYLPLQEDEKLMLLEKIAELNKQKSQLLHHVFMVSCENKSLWGKLSLIKSPDKNVVRDIKQPLVRTNTYIHSTSKSNSKNQEKHADISLEEISLKMINNFILEKSQLIEQYEQMVQKQDDDDNILNFDSIGFVYMEDPPTDSLKEIQNQTEKLLSLKKELIQQEKDLKVVIARIETVLKDGYKCPTCVANRSKNISLENKETAISDSLMNWDEQENSDSPKNQLDKDFQDSQKVQVRSDSSDKMCPICGDTFQANTSFTDFQSHVESHFIGETEVDSIDNFDTIHNSLDNII